MAKDYLDQVPLRGATLTRKAVIAAAKKHKASDEWKAAKSQKFVLVIDGKEYPPKNCKRRRRYTRQSVQRRRGVKRQTAPPGFRDPRKVTRRPIRRLSAACPCNG